MNLHLSLTIPCIFLWEWVITDSWDVVSGCVNFFLLWIRKSLNSKRNMWPFNLSLTMLICYVKLYIYVSSVMNFIGIECIFLWDMDFHLSLTSQHIFLREWVVSVSWNVVWLETFFYFEPGKVESIKINKNEAPLVKV